MRSVFAAVCVLAGAGAFVLHPERRSPFVLRAEQVVSPFAGSGGTSTAKSDTGEAVEFSRQAVDQVLDEVRPMLLADGGNVAVVSVAVETKDVILQLQGACGSCPSSTTTMKMGIEKVLRERWSDLGSVTRDDDPVNQPFDVETVEKLIAPIANAVAKLGATAEIVSAGDKGPGIVEVKYEGPENVRIGIELSLMDSPLITEVIWL